MKKQYAPEYKAQVVREILKEEKTMAQIAAEYGVHPGPNLSKRNMKHKIYLYLLRHVTPSHSNHVWGIDIT